MIVKVEWTRRALREFTPCGLRRLLATKSTFAQCEGITCSKLSK